MYEPIPKLSISPSVACVVGPNENSLPNNFLLPKPGFYNLVEIFNDKNY